MTPARNQSVPEPVDGYEFGRLPRTAAHFPFSTREFARLLVLRGRVRDGLFGAEDVAPSEHKMDADTLDASLAHD